MLTKSPRRIVAASLAGIGGRPSPTYTPWVAEVKPALACGRRFAINAATEFPDGELLLPGAVLSPVRVVADAALCSVEPPGICGIPASAVAEGIVVPKPAHTVCIADSKKKRGNTLCVSSPLPWCEWHATG